MKIFRPFYIGQGIDLFITLIGAWLMWASIYTDLFTGPASKPSDCGQVAFLGTVIVVIGLYQVVSGVFKHKIRYQKDGEFFISQENLKEYKNMTILVVNDYATILTTRQIGVVKNHILNKTPLKAVKYYDKNKNYLSQSYYL